MNMPTMNIPLSGMWTVVAISVKAVGTLYILWLIAHASPAVFVLVLLYLWHKRRFPFFRITKDGIEC